MTLIAIGVSIFCALLFTGCYNLEFMNRERGAVGIFVMMETIPCLATLMGGVGSLFSRWMSKRHLQRTGEPYQHCWFCG